MNASTSTPFFSAPLLVTAPDGTYGGIRKRRTVSAFDDRIELGDVKIYYPYLADLRVYGNVLHVAYVASDGKQCEYFFRHDTFLERRGEKQLADMASKVEKARAAMVKPSIWRSQPPAQEHEGLRSERLEPTSNGWQRVAVYSALVAFPAICPVCALPADAVDHMRLSAGFDEKGSWLVPICGEHRKQFLSYLGVENWRAGTSRLTFTVWNGTYAREFLTVNEQKDTEHIRRQAESSHLLMELKRGKRFVLYQYAVSALVVSFLQPSKIEVLSPGQSSILRGLKYSAISLIAGWWGIPAGPIFTVASVWRNSKGGIDMTETVAAVLSGAAVAGGGY